MGGRLLAVHPVVSLGLGTALVLSLGAVCCGLGLISAPWFACELSALLLATTLGRRVPRHAGWISAGLIQAVAVVVISAAAGAAVSWWGTQALTVHAAPPGGSRDLIVLALAIGGGTVALLYMLPYLYAPLLLIDRGGSMGGALVESARLVMRGGLWGHLALSLVSHLLQVAPPVVAGAIAYAAGDPGTVPVAVAVALPAMVVTIPLGQAMIVSGYAGRRPQLLSEEPLGRPVGRPLALVLAAVGLAPAVALILLALAVAVRPSQPEPGTAPLGEVVAGGAVGEEVRTFAIPHRALEVRVGPRKLAVEAGDGGGAGPVPTPAGARFDRARVVRVRASYAIEVADGERSWVTWVDGSGVRLDDDLAARLADHLPPWGLPLLALTMVSAALLLGPALSRLARGGTDDRRRAWIVAGVLAPLVATALLLAARALAG